MATADQTVAVFSTFDLNSIDEGWVQGLWEADLAEVEGVPLEVEESLSGRDWLCSELQASRTLLAAWLAQREAESREGLWTVFVENDIPYKTLVAVLAYLMDSGSKIDSNAKKVEAAIASACNYLYLIAVPGSSAFKIYNPQLFLKATDLLKIWSRLESVSSKRKKQDSSSQSSQRGKKARRPQQSQEASQEAELISSQFDDEEEAEVVEWSPQEKDVIRGWLKVLLQDVVLLVEQFSLKQSESTVYHLIQTLADVAGLEPDGIGRLDSWPSLDRMAPSYLAVRGLSSLVLPLHNMVGAATRTAFQCLLPYLLMLTRNGKVCTAQTIPRPLVVARDAMVQVVRHIAHLAGERSTTPLRTLLQHLCTKVPDRAEYRAKVAQVVVVLLREMPDAAYASFMEWLSRLSQHAKINNRVVALEVVCQLLPKPERNLQVSNEVSEADCQMASQKCLLTILLERCSDIAPSVRARAISGFSACLVSRDASMTDVIQAMVTPQAQGPSVPQRLIPTPGRPDSSPADHNGPEAGAEAGEPSGREPTISFADKDAAAAAASPGTSAAAAGFQNIALTPNNPNLLDAEGVISMLRRRCRDEKVNVRKAAVQAVEGFLLFRAPAYQQENVEVLVKCCGDPALSVRKQAMQALTNILLRLPGDKTLQSSWLSGVLPLVMDRETSLQESCIDILEEVILRNIQPHARSGRSEHVLAWSLVAVAAKEENEDLRRFLQRACRQFAQKGKVKSGHITALQSHINTDNKESAWLLLELFASSFASSLARFIEEFWEEQAGQWTDLSDTTVVRVLHIIGLVAKHVGVESRGHITADLKNRLLKFDSTPAVVTALVNTVYKLGKVEERSEGDWCEDLLLASDTFLSHTILEGKRVLSPAEENLVINHLYTLSEISQLSPCHTPSRIFTIVQSLVAAPCLPVETMEDAFASQGLQTTQSSQGSQAAFSQFRAPWMTSRLRAFAFIVLGKLCLQNEDIAKKSIPALARELDISSDLAIRNNAIVIMCDLCVRYSTLVDNHIINIAACLKDESPLIRKQTLTLMTRLLQEDFLKWKGVLFYRFITTLLDEVTEIRTFAQFCLVQVLLPRQPTMLFQHFVECIFHFNAYQNHPMYNKFQQSDNERKLFSLSGKQNTGKRMQLYLFMLDHMSDEHRFHLTAKVSQEILGGMVDGLMPLDTDTSLLLADALAILSSKEIKLASCRTQAQSQESVEENEVVAAVKKTLITQVMKKNVVENVIPIVISLKQMLEKQRSPLVQDLMCCLRELMKDFKNEVKEWLAADKQLAAELEFDLQKFEQQQGAETTPAPAAAPCASPQMARRSPHPAPAAAAVPSTTPAQPASASSTTQANVATPRTPQCSSNSPSSGSPRVLAMQNSARQALERLRLLQQNSLPQQRSPAPLTAQRENWPPQPQKNETAKSQTPARPKRTHAQSRAISTPATTLAHITFTGEQNLSFVPPSPIPSAMPIRLYPSTASEDNDSSGSNENMKGKEDMVYMFSPDKKLPKPRKWKVKPSGQTSS